jgi:hypothetical protein
MAGYISNSRYDDFQGHMNPPEDGFDGTATVDAPTNLFGE